MPGPDRVTPFIGGLVEMVLDPFSFWEKQKDACNVSSPGYSYNSLAGKMIMTVTDAGWPAAQLLAGRCKPLAGGGVRVVSQ